MKNGLTILNAHDRLLKIKFYQGQSFGYMSQQTKVQISAVKISMSNIFIVIPQKFFHLNAFY